MKKTISAVAILVLTAACTGADDQQSSKSKDAAQQTAAKQNQQDFKTMEDRFSYASGLEWAERLKAEGIELNADLMAEAMRAVFNGGEKRMSNDEAAATIGIYREIYEKEKAEKREVAAEKNKKEGEAFLKENAKKEGVVVTNSGLQYKVITAGKKAGQKPTLEDEIKVNYRGTFINGTEFDSTYKRNQPYTAAVSALMKGWIEALQLMSQGSKWELYIPAELAYGEEGSDPHVGPNAVLIFEVELLEIVKR
jgi:FKBP-type peptidyl-prolyl cis-trans isomerase